jgi:hypothetical protein
MSYEFEVANILAFIVMLIIEYINKTLTFCIW